MGRQCHENFRAIRPKPAPRAVTGRSLWRVLVRDATGNLIDGGPGIDLPRRHIVHRRPVDSNRFNPDRDRLSVPGLGFYEKFRLYSWTIFRGFVR